MFSNTCGVRTDPAPSLSSICTVEGSNSTSFAAATIMQYAASGGSSRSSVIVLLHSFLVIPFFFLQDIQNCSQPLHRLKNTLHSGIKPTCIGTFRIYVRREKNRQIVLHQIQRRQIERRFEINHMHYLAGFFLTSHKDSILV